MMNDTSSEDPWASLAEELGVPEPAHKPHSHRVERKETPVHQAKIAEAEVEPEIFDAPEAMEAVENSDESDDPDATEIDNGEPDSPTAEGGKKKRRRRRRGKKKPDEAVAATEAVVVATTPVPVAAVAVAEMGFDNGEEGDFEADLSDSEDAEPDHLAVALDEEMEADTNHEKTVWKVTSWKELVGGLHRPDR